MASDGESHSHKRTESSHTVECPAVVLIKERGTQILSFENTLYLLNKFLQSEVKWSVWLKSFYGW